MEHLPKRFELFLPKQLEIFFAETSLTKRPVPNWTFFTQDPESSTAYDLKESKNRNVGHIRCMHARPHRRKDQLPLRPLRDLRSR